MYYDECLCRRRIAWRLKSIYSRHFDASKTCAKAKTHQHQEQALVLFCFIKHMQGKISPNHRMMVAAAAAALRQIENKFIHIVLRAGQGTRSEQHKGMDKHNKTRAATVIQSRRVAPRRGGSNISPARRAATRYIPSASRRDACAGDMAETRGLGMWQTFPIVILLFDERRRQKREEEVYETRPSKCGRKSREETSLTFGIIKIERRAGFSRASRKHGRRCVQMPDHSEILEVGGQGKA